MDLRTVLTTSEKNMMRNYIDAYVENHQGEAASIDYILRVWNENKQDLYKIFGNELILEKEVEFKEPAFMLAEKIKNSTIISNFIDKIRNYFFKMDRKNLLSYRQFSVLTGLCYSDYLAENIVHFPYDGIERIDVEINNIKIVIQKGAKITKTLKKIADAANIDGYEEFRLAHSMALNTKNMHGTLCLSIHPLDYMTMSDNASKWSSCMSWEEFGCYRRGTVEMMNSNNVIVAYLKSNDQTFMMPGGYIWNNKKWRSLFIIDPNVICNVKAYPYQSDELVKIVDEWILELVKKSGLDSNYTETLERIYPGENREYASNNVIRFYFETGAMYNDIDNDENIHRFGYVNNSMSDLVTVFYSGPSECMCCGSIDYDFDTEESLICWECYEDERPVCPICGEHFYEDDGYYLGDELICPCCHDDRTVSTFDNNDRILTSNSHHFMICTDDYSEYYYFSSIYEDAYGTSEILDSNILDLSKIKVFKDRFYDPGNAKLVFFIPISAIKTNYSEITGHKIFHALGPDGKIVPRDNYSLPLTTEPWIDVTKDFLKNF